jgi:serine/threonine protein kinase
VSRSEHVARAEEHRDAHETSRVETKPPSASSPPGAEREVLGGRYELLGELDTGGTAVIHRARDLTTGAVRAIKVLKPHAVASPVLRSLFLSGARAAMEIHHPNVVRILDVQEPSEGIPYAAMELLEGEPLYRTLEREQVLVPERAVKLMRGVAQGLAAAHASDVIHCDMKPENLFLVNEEGEERLKIIDFDLAWVPAPKPEDDGELLRGTAKYMAPEQVLGDPVDARTDVYAVGIVLFRMLTGHLPFDLEVGTTLLRHHLSSSVPPPSWLIDDLDVRLDAIVERATRKHPENRYPNMLALLADLDALSSDFELSAHQVTRQSDRYVPLTARADERASMLGLSPKKR